MASGELREAAAPPKDATPEQMTAWRKEQGLPENAAAYVSGLKLADGMIPGDNDKPLIASFAERAAAQNIPQESFNALVGWWFETQDQMTAQRTQHDAEYRNAGAEQLRKEWGGDFRGNNNALASFWQSAPQGIADTILGARTADGRTVGDIPEIATFFVGLARVLDPAATLMPAGSAGGLKGIASRKAEIEGMMYVDGKPNPGYFRNEAIQKEYRDLIDAETKLSARAA